YLARVDSGAKVKVSYEHAGYEWMKLGEAKLFKNYEELLKRADLYIDRLEEIEILNDEYSDLPNAVKDWELSHNFVPGDGPVNAKIMVVGQAPGRTEDAHKKPFVGMAGKLLTSLLKKAGLERSEVYITSVVQFFPPDNRLPTEKEARICLPFLKKQIGIIKPHLIILLGNFASYNIYGEAEVMKIHGYLIKSNEYGCDIFVSLHPAAAVRMKKLVPVMEKDFTELKKLLDEKGLL
ncbi:MAG TPA: uracil-DNA glycosylase family protein, partial [Dissulfurispiraceae bacterium]|nr:uracil-DNA glycosylase family protein [Dissulfurispiraceae bacterium]